MTVPCRGLTLTSPKTDFFSHFLLSVAVPCPVPAFIIRPHYPSEFAFQNLLFQTTDVMGIHNGTLLQHFFSLFKMFPQMGLPIDLPNEFSFTK